MFEVLEKRTRPPAGEGKKKFPYVTLTDGKKFVLNIMACREILGVNGEYDHEEIGDDQKANLLYDPEENAFGIRFNKSGDHSVEAGCRTATIKSNVQEKIDKAFHNIKLRMIPEWDTENKLWRVNLDEGVEVQKRQGPAHTAGG